MGGYTRVVAVMDGIGAAACRADCPSGQFRCPGQGSGRVPSHKLGLAADLDTRGSCWRVGMRMRSLDLVTWGFCRSSGTGLSLTGGIAVLAYVTDTGASRTYLLTALSIATAMDLATRYMLGKYPYPLWKISRPMLRVGQWALKRG